MTRRWPISVRGWVIRTVQVAVFAALAVLVWRAADGWEALARLQAADPLWLAAAALALTAQTVLSALRWRITAGQLGISITSGEAIREYYLSQVVNQSLPGGVVGDASRAVRARGQAGLMASGQAVLFERLAGQIGLLALLIAGFALSVLASDPIDWPLWLLGPVAIAFIALALIPVGLAIALRVTGPSDHALRRSVRAFIHALWARDVRGRQAALSLGTAFCNVAAFALCAVALGVDLPLVAVFTLIPLILFAMVLPLSISGWGLREGAAAALFPVIGAAMSEGLATSIAFGLVFLATVLPGLLVTWMRPNAPVLGRR